MHNSFSIFFFLAESIHNLPLCGTFVRAAVFIYGIGWPLEDGYPREMPAADYEDWSLETVSEDRRPMHGLNGDILVQNPVTKRRHELMSGGIRVTAVTLRKPLEIAGQTEFLRLPYHGVILNDDIPLSIEEV